MLEFLRVLFLVLHFSYYALMIFLILLSVILLSMLMILPFPAPSVIRNLICGNNQNWLLNLNLIYDILWTGAWSGLLISMLKKLKWFHLASLIKTGAIDVKMDGSVLEENHLLKCWGWLSLLSWIGTLTLFLMLKLPERKLQPWFFLWSYLLLRLLCISINLP